MTNSILPVLRSNGSLSALPFLPRIKAALQNAIEDAWVKERGQSHENFEKLLATTDTLPIG